jgi:hypothetical protein
MIAQMVWEDRASGNGWIKTKKIIIIIRSFLKANLFTTYLPTLYSTTLT